jgi:hypothetical protein
MTSYPPLSIHVVGKMPIIPSLQYSQDFNPHVLVPDQGLQSNHDIRKIAPPAEIKLWSNFHGPGQAQRGVYSSALRQEPGAWIWGGEDGAIVAGGGEEFVRESGGGGL